MPLLLILLVLASPVAQAAELLKVNVDHQGRLYKLYLQARLKLPARDVEIIITDFNHLNEINPYLKQSRIESVDEAQNTLVHLITESCVLFICYEVKHDQLFQPLRDGVLVATIASEHSDFHSGRFTWTVRAEGEFSLIEMETEVEPNFIIPPMIGPYMLEQKLREIALSTVRNIQRVGELNRAQTP